MPCSSYRTSANSNPWLLFVQILGLPFEHSLLLFDSCRHHSSHQTDRAILWPRTIRNNVTCTLGSSTLTIRARVHGRVSELLFQHTVLEETRARVTITIWTGLLFENGLLLLERCDCTGYCLRKFIIQARVSKHGTLSWSWWYCDNRSLLVTSIRMLLLCLVDCWGMSVPFQCLCQLLY